jgi:predicted ATP-dependent endonuclease of OLD family
MILKELTIKGYKCFRDSDKIPMHDFTVFIGENDSGKSSIIKVLDCLINNTIPEEIDFYKSVDGIQVETIEICSKWIPSERDHEAINNFILKKEVSIKKIIDKSNIKTAKYFVEVEKFNDDDINGYERKTVSQLKEILEKYNLDTKNATKPELISRLEQFIKTNTLPKEIGFVDIAYSTIKEFFPLFRSYESSDYGDPVSLIQKTLATKYRSYFYEKDEEDQEVLKESFRQVKSEAEKDFEKYIRESLKDIIVKYNQKVKDITAQFGFTFGSGFSLNRLDVDTGTGYIPLNNRGQGSKKRLFLAILEWDKEILKNVQDKDILKCFDEPDANLHYDAQRKIYQAIFSENEANDNIQTILCTHSIAMIDRTPVLNINRTILDENECSIIDYLESHQEGDVREFLDQISEISGLTNSSLFYEKCFVLVEGESEENALPLMYKTLHGRRMAEDGITIINLRSCGAWEGLLKVMGKNKQKSTLLYLDSDCKSPKSNVRVTPEKLTEIGFDVNFIHNNVFYAGLKEFEDEYPNNALLKVLEVTFPKLDNTEWTIHDIQSIKDRGGKYSHLLVKEIKSISNIKTTKPQFAYEFGRSIRPPDIMNFKSVMQLFNRIQEIIA